jgi:hypothetical protein
LLPQPIRYGAQAANAIVVPTTENWQAMMGGRHIRVPVWPN